MRPSRYEVYKQDGKRWWVAAQDFNVRATLESGQTFSWKKVEGDYRGWIEKIPVSLKLAEGGFWVEGIGLSESLLEDYFDLKFDYQGMLEQGLPVDPWIQQAVEFAPGLRLLHQPIWETLANFICSAVKQIIQIEQINLHLRERFGDEVLPGRFSYPEPKKILEVGESSLRECKLGFRAPHLHAAAEAVISGTLNLEELENLPTEEARKRLMQIRGVGEKIANCVLLFSCRKYEVFPVDVWVERVLRELYFAKKRNITSQQLRVFASSHFGTYGGYAQQFLFHWVRLGYRNETWTASAVARRRK
jgi:N-glycosylase/DNA lyase